MESFMYKNNVSFISLGKSCLWQARTEILNSSNTEESATMVSIEIVTPTIEMPNYGDCLVVDRGHDDEYLKQVSESPYTPVDMDTKDSESADYNIYSVADYKGFILPEALRCSLREAFRCLNKNKVKADIIYLKHFPIITDENEEMNLICLIQNVMAENKIDADLWIEKVIADGPINHSGILSMNYSDKSDKKKKDKKKKKKY